MGMDQEQLKYMRESGKINSLAIEHAIQNAVPGVSLIQLDQMIDSFIKNQNAFSAFKGYMGYQHASCLSVNNIAVHGVPSPYILKLGDKLSIDVGTVKHDWYSDAARTIVIGNSHFKSDSEIICLALIDIIKPGMTAWDLCTEADRLSKIHNMNIFEDFGGHFIGRSLHEQSILFHSTNIKKEFSDKMKSIIFKEMDTICIEPIVTKIKPKYSVHNDGWSVLTCDPNCSHHEHTILITNSGNEILS